MVPTTDRVRLSGRAEPEWVGGLIVFSVFGYVFASFLSSRRYALVLPLSRKVVQRYRRLRHLSIALVIAGPVLAAIAALTQVGGALWFLALTPIGLCVGTYNISTNNVRVMTDQSGSLVMAGVHPDFAHSLHALSSVGRGQVPA